MSQNRKVPLVIKIVLIGVLILGIIFLFHPDTGQLSIMVNGAPINQTLLHFSIIPTLFLSLLFIGILMVLAFLGIGMILFTAILIFIMLGFILIAPYLWPILLIIFIIVFIMSFVDKKH